LLTFGRQFFDNLREARGSAPLSAIDTEPATSLVITPGNLDDKG
jgi:hypothetical protein